MKMKNAKVLSDNRDFLRLYRRGDAIVSPLLVTYARRNGTKKTRRVGITATKKIGGAVQRNRAKRLIRAAWRETEQTVPGGWDLVFVARGITTRAKMQEVRRIMSAHLFKLTSPKAPQRPKKGSRQGKGNPQPQKNQPQSSKPETGQDSPAT